MGCSPKEHRAALAPAFFLSCVIRLDHGQQSTGEHVHIELIGTAAHKAAVLSFTMKGVHAHDLGTILDAEGVAVRTGHHCAMPVMTFFGVPATARASFGCYNTEGDVSSLVRALRRAREVFI